jgi:hypothetical protein
MDPQDDELTGSSFPGDFRGGYFQLFNRRRQDPGFNNGKHAGFSFLGKEVGFRFSPLEPASMEKARFPGRGLPGVFLRNRYHNRCAVVKRNRSQIFQMPDAKIGGPKEIFKS